MARQPAPNGLSCEICGNPLTGKQRRACSQPCRTKLSTKTRADRAALSRQVAETEVTRQVAAKVGEAVDQAFTQEGLMESVLQQVGAMVGMLPTAIGVLHKNLASKDEEVAQKAAKELLRWTLGNASVAPKPVAEEDKPLQVIFNVPGGELPDLQRREPAGDLVESVDDDAPDLRECVECHLLKPEDEFVGASPRCQECHDRIVGSVADRFGGMQLG